MNNGNLYAHWSKLICSDPTMEPSDQTNLFLSLLCHVALHCSLSGWGCGNVGQLQSARTVYFRKGKHWVYFFCDQFKLPVSQIASLCVPPVNHNICNYRRWCYNLAKFTTEVTIRRVSWNNRFLWPENQWSINQLPGIEWLAQVNLITKRTINFSVSRITFHICICLSGKVARIGQDLLVVLQLHVV